MSASSWPRLKPSFENRNHPTTGSESGAGEKRWRNPHALHMPTHIYTRLGDWDAVIRGNLRAAEAAGFGDSAQPCRSQPPGKPCDRLGPGVAVPIELLTVSGKGTREAALTEAKTFVSSRNR